MTQQETAQQAKLLFADPHTMFVEALAVALEREGDVSLIASATTAAEVLDAVEKFTPTVILLSDELEGGALPVLRALSARQLRVPVIILSPRLTDSNLIDAMRLGVAGVLVPTMPLRLLVQCIRKVSNGGQWLENASASRVMQRLLRTTQRGASTPLSRRELDIVRMVGSGLRNREVAERLFISQSTVKVHLNNIFEKLQVASRVQLTVYAHEHGLL